jgi:hypothetical protein
MAASTGWRGRVLIGALAATMLIAIAAVPSFGATKKFVLDVKPNSAIAGSTTDFTVTLTNTTPGNSSINSFSVDVPFPLATGTTVSAQVLPPPGSTNPNPMATVNIVDSQVRVQNIASVKTNQFIRLKITATPAALAAGTCSSDPYLWTATAYAGNSLNGDQFLNVGTDAQRQTTLLACIGLRFVTGFEPKDGVVGTDMHVQVEAVTGGTRVTAFTGQVTIVKDSGPGALSGNVATASGGLADFPNFQGDTAGDYVVKATSPGATDSSTAAFTLFEEEITCGDVVTEGPVTVTWLQNPGGAFPPCATGDTKPVTVSKLGNDVEILSSGEFDATFKVEINAWDPEKAVPAVPVTEVQPPEPFHPGLWCEGTPPPPGSSDVSGLQMPVGESWCRVTQSTTTYGPDGDGSPGNPDWVPDYEGQLMQVSETWLLTADAGCRR